MFDPQLGDTGLFQGQVHDFNPGIAQSGLFWTTIVESSAVSADLGVGTATYEVRDLPQKDYYDFENAILGNGARPRMGHVSFRVQWNAIGAATLQDNPGQQYRSSVKLAEASMEWSGRSGDFEFRSFGLSTSSVWGAQIGTERNGSFYPGP